MITCYCFLEGLQGEPTVYFVVNTDQGHGCFPLNKQQPLILEAENQHGGESDYLARDGPSSSGSFHSSEGEGTDHEGDILDCSGSRPLLIDSEEEEESGKINPPQEGSKVFQEVLNPPSSQSGMGPLLLNTSQHHPAEASDEGDVFATAPFRSSRTFHDDLDIFAKAPFVSKSHTVATQPDEGDVFLQAPFTKRKSQEELASCSAAKESPAVAAFLGLTGGAQYVLNPTFQNPDTGMHSSPLPPYSMAPFAQSSIVPPHSLQAGEGQDSIPPKDAPKELGSIPNDTLQGHTLPHEALLGSNSNKPFHPQSLAKYSRHYGPEGSQCVEAQPIAAYKVVSQTNKQAIAGSVSIASLSYRTKELPTADPFASAPFPSKLGK
uniref:uncharacterized protein FLJ45252-like n=1 Tax=Euleptes europaea TaxID=460621 RepID=UPI00253FAFEE|nr:uncharacterized protein FLJ45252-like [Euleptes europaea]